MEGWLKKGRSSSAIGNSYLAIWELGKYQARCKVSPVWLPTAHNVTADALSRNQVPGWLKRDGREIKPHLDMIAQYVAYPIRAWRENL